jgi:hypothetical protein
MTHMDDQVAKHIKEMILKITRKPTGNQEPPRNPEPLDRIVRILRSPYHPHDLTFPPDLPGVMRVLGPERLTQKDLWCFRVLRAVLSASGYER